MTSPSPSPKYRRWWSRGWGAVTGLGFGLSLLIWPPFTVAGSFVMVSGLAGMFLLALPADRDVSARGGVTGRSWQIVRRAANVGAAFMAAAAVGDVLVSVSALLIFMAAASSPPVVAFCTQGATGMRGSEDAREFPPTRLRAQGDLLAESHAVEQEDPWSGGCLPSELDDRELCRAWRHSYLALESPASAAALMRVVELRRSYLEEFQRRSPRALEAWLASGARAASGPDRYLLDDAHQSPPATD